MASDVFLIDSCADILTDFFSVIGTLVVVCYASPFIIAVVVPLIVIFFFIQVVALRGHQPTSGEFQN
jgi:hypothetical protein